MKLKTALSFFALSLLVGCSNTPKQFIFSPNYTVAHQAVINKNMSLVISDKRSSTITVSVNNNGNMQTFNNRDLAQSMTPAMVQALAKIGVINSANSPVLSVNIRVLNSIVKQSIYKHTVSSKAELEVEINNTKQRYTKRYKGTRQSEAPLNYDKADVEKQVNRLIEELITRIVTDPEFIDALTQ